MTRGHWQTPDLPFRGIDHVLVRCDDAGPTLAVENCRRVFAGVGNPERPLPGGVDLWL